MGGILQTGSLKKRKPSSFSAASSTHPLRQTSFPPEEGQEGARSPSVESDYTTVTGNQSVVTSAPGGKKRGRKRKDAESVKSADKTRTADGRSRGGLDDDAEEDEGEGEGEGADDNLVDAGHKIDRVAEQKRMAYACSQSGVSGKLLIYL